MDDWLISDEEFEKEFAAAAEAEKKAVLTEPRATAVRYDSSRKRVEIELADGCLFAFPVEYAQGLKGASAEELADVEILPGGDALHWRSLDVGLYVPGLLRGLFGSKRWMSELGRAGGLITSPAKAMAARENGKKGGRPRKKTANG